MLRRAYSALLGRRDDVVAIGCLVALTFALFAPALFGALWSHRDFPRWTYPSRELWLEAVRAGRLPQWNPTIGLGVPTLAIPVHGSFYPGNVLLLATPLGLFFALHAALGGVGGYLLARSRACRPSAAFLSGAVFSVGGYAVSMWGNGEKVLSGVWVPWSAYAIVLLTTAERFEWRRVAWTALPLALLATAGDPFLWLHAVALGLAAGNIKTLLRLAPAGALGMLLAAPALVPAVALIGDTERASGLGDQAALWSMHPVRLLELVAPGALGDPYGEYPGSRFVSEIPLGATPWAVSIYCGAAIALFASFACKRAPLVIACLSFLLLASGRYVHVLVPLMRYPEKHVLVAIGALALLGSLGLERYLAEQVPLRAPAIVFAGCAGLALLLAPADLRPHVIPGVLHASVFAAMLLGAVYLSRRRPKLIPLIPALVAVDLFLAAIPLVGYIKPARPALVDALRTGTPYPPRLYRPRIGGAEFETLAENVGELYGIAHVPGHDAALPAKLHQLWDRLPGEQAMSLFAIDWMLVPSTAAPPSAVPTATFGDLTLLRWPRAVRVRLSNQVVIAPDHAPISTDTTTVAPGPDARALNGAAFSGACAIVAYAHESVAIECDVRDESLMILADSFAKGWTATVDGAPAALHRTNVVMRGVYLTPGRHRVEMRYRTPGLTLGLVCGALGLLCFTVCIRRRRAD